MKPQYSKSSVQPIQVDRVSEEEVQLSYRVLPETTFYSKGVNYQSDGRILKVYIDRCNIDAPCDPMAESLIPLDARWEAKVRLPYRDEQIVVMHADGEEAVYP